MNDHLIEDLKQFIEATASQSEQRIMAKMDERFAEVDKRIDEVSDGTNQQTVIITEHFDKAVASLKATADNHEECISSLERRAA